MNRTIYLADDEKNIREVVKSFLESEGYAVEAFDDGLPLLDAFKHKPADLVILDVMMPAMDGFTVCKELRKTSTVPIIMLTARDSDLDYATDINLGGDDYFTKPFSAIALVMRVKAIFRRLEYDKQQSGPRASDARVSFGDIIVDIAGKLVQISGHLVDLTPNEYSLLEYLVENQDRAVSRDELLDKVWGYENDVETRAVDDTMRRLRKKLAASTVVIDTVWGFGFRLKERS